MVSSMGLATDIGEISRRVVLSSVLCLGGGSDCVSKFLSRCVFLRRRLEVSVGPGVRLAALGLLVATIAVRAGGAVSSTGQTPAQNSGTQAKPAAPATGSQAKPSAPQG